MKKNLDKLLLCFLFLLVYTVSAQAYSIEFQDWGFNPNINNIGLIQPLDEMSLLGLTLNNSTPESEGHGTFKTIGTLQAENFQNNNVITYTGVNASYQITATLETTGRYDINPTGTNDLTFHTGTLNLYIDTVFNYGSYTDFFGANDGIQIASFNLISGSGLMDYREEPPDGRTDLTFEATMLAAGYWFDVNGNDMSLNLNTSQLVIAVTDSNNVILRNKSTIGQIAIDEFTTNTGFTWNTNNDPNFETFISTNGSFALTTTPIPEPATLFLIGFGLIGLAGFDRKKVIDKV